MEGRSWKKVERAIADEIKKYLLDNGGIEKEVKNTNEVWRVRFSDSTFTYYKNGTLFSTPSRSLNGAVFQAWEYIDSLLGSMYVLPSKDFLIGLDETGKGELIGHTVLTGVIFPKELFKRLDWLIGPADTKKRHKFEYWDNLFGKLDVFRKLGLNFITEKIPPWHVDLYNLNKIMDITYQRILSIFLREIETDRCRIVLDNYGIGPTLKRFLRFLEKRGAEIVVTNNAEEKYLEAKIASLISKRTREEVIKRINEDPKFQINGLSIGSGNASDKQTKAWLEKWYELHKDWPWFIKRSFKTIRKIEGKTGKVKKIVPPIKEELLSKEFLDKFNQGKLSILSLSVICPYCGTECKSVTFAIYKGKNGRKISGMKCVSCKRIIEHAGITLRYYCGYIVPDSSAIRRGVIGKDLQSSRTFENYTVILTPVVRRECGETYGGKEEFDRLAKFSAMGRIKLETVGSLKEITEDMPKEEKDERIVDTALQYNAIILTADGAMRAYAMGKKVFTIFI